MLELVAFLNDSHEVWETAGYAFLNRGSALTRVEALPL